MVRGNPFASLVEFTLAPAGSSQHDFSTLALWTASTCPSLATPGQRVQHHQAARSNVNSVCPSELAVTGVEQGVMACKSACWRSISLDTAAPGVWGALETCPPDVLLEDIQGPVPSSLQLRLRRQKQHFHLRGSCQWELGLDTRLKRSPGIVEADSCCIYPKLESWLSLGGNGDSWAWEAAASTATKLLLSSHAVAASIAVTSARVPFKLVPPHAAPSAHGQTCGRELTPLFRHRVRPTLAELGCCSVPTSPLLPVPRSSLHQREVLTQRR
ncbi:hypothetical protein NL676_009654 [Syzygium grande]|nr:hypothetical protein NL676_009654 [Syzygium grande]